MNLRQIDLNLLVAFDALMTTRHVTRAARLVGIGQPGMSGSLARLRQMFGDDLLVKQGGEMAPTARALELEPEIRRLLHEVDRLVTDPGGFDAATSRRHFSLRMSDLLSFLLLPTLAQRLGREAPHIQLEIAHFGPDATVDALERSSVELAVSTNLRISKSIESAPLFEDRVVVIARQRHPAQMKIRSVDHFLSLPQIKVAQSPLDDRFADRRLTSMGERRPVALTVPHWLAVPEIVSRSDLVAVVPESIASRLAENHRIALSELPLADTSFTWALYWHRRHAGDRGLAWLRDQIASASRQSSV